MKGVVTASTLQLFVWLYLPQAFVWFYLVFCIWGNADWITAVRPYIIAYELGCIIYVFIWLWGTAQYLRARLAAMSLDAGPFIYFRTFWITLAVIVAIMAALTLQFLIPHHIKAIYTFALVFEGFGKVTIPLISGCCFYFIFMWARMAEQRSAMSYTRALPYFLAGFFIPAAIIIAHYKTHSIWLNRDEQSPGEL